MTSAEGKPDQMGQLDPNVHLKNYLSYYQALETPLFAVLITGEWGTGKTHLVKKLLPWEGDDPKAYYVSLFGLKSSEELVAAVYAEMYPLVDKAQKGIEKLGEAIKGMSLYGVGIGGAGSVIANLLAANIRKEVDPSKVIIFDDLERSDINDKVLLGIINHYVEHYKCRVVVIAHDEKLVEGIKEAKEKIFGQTIRIEPDMVSAFDAFLDEIKSAGGNRFVQDYREVLTTVFKQSEVKSLRILRQGMFDLARLFETLEETHTHNKNAMREMVALFAAYNFEVRAGRLCQSDLENRAGKRLLRAVSSKLDFAHF
jgi:hypothetical protein